MADPPTSLPGGRRPLCAAAAATTAAHHVFELAAGVGLVWQPQLGLVGAGLLWAVQLPVWALTAVRGRQRWDRSLAAMSGTALAGAAVHYTVWPWRRGPLGWPVLTAAEGLSARQLPAYNAILTAWAVTAAASLLVEVKAPNRRWAAWGLVAFPLLRISARHHFRWATEAAHTHPAWWNRGLQG
ncbi:MAG TPA: hypothetical protein VKU91_01950 [Acidimicrobiales bacterium]|nr:hypothetical protein [Acidimicrobiales bacterium]